MSLPAAQVLISADDHLDIHAMPPDVWSSGLPQDWRERGPHVEDTPEGQYWFSAAVSASHPAAARRRGSSQLTTTASGPASHGRDSRTWTATASTRR